MEHYKSSAGNKEKFGKLKDENKNCQHRKLASCISFLVLLILSSLVTIGLSVLYVEVNQLGDELTMYDIKQSLPVELSIQSEPLIQKEDYRDKVKIVDKIQSIETKNKKVENKKTTVKENKNTKSSEDFKKEDIIDDKLKPSDKINNKKDQNAKTNSFTDKKNIDKLNTVRKVVNKVNKNISEDENLIPNKIVHSKKEKIDPVKNKTNKESNSSKETPSKLNDIEKEVITEKDREELLELYISVEELTDEVLSKDPNNEMVRELAPHLETTLKDIELNRISGIKEGLLHIKTILKDLKKRIFETAANKGESQNPKNSSIEKKDLDKDNKVPVDEVIPDPIYIAPRGEKTANIDSSSKKKLPKKEKSDKTKQKVQDIEKFLGKLKLEAEKNPKDVIKKTEEALLSNPNNAELLFLKAETLASLSDSMKSNEILEKAINTYQSIIDLAKKDPSSVSTDTLQMAGLNCAEKLIFRGFQNQAVQLLQEMIKFFPKEISFRNKLGVVFLTINDLHSAKNIFEESLTLDPSDGFAQVHYGFILKSEDVDLNRAVKYLETGIRSGAKGTVDGRFYFHLGDALQRINKTEMARQIYQEGAEKGLFLNHWQRSLYNVDRLKSQPIWSLEETTYAQFFRKLENSWKKIKLEGLTAMSIEGELGFKPESENLKNTGDWRQFELFVRGQKNAKNCAKAPITCGLIENFAPAAGCKRGQIKFSVMYPDTHVWPHTGPTNCRLRAHLGLVVPDGLKLRIAEQILTWKEGKVIVFDDSWEHEVWHEGSSPRLILIVDVWHPDLSDGERRSLTAI